MLNKVTREELCNCCDLSDLPFKTTDDVQPLEGTIGQERALSALEFGLDINSHGFNIYILGESGTGKMTTIRKILEEKAKDEPTPDDWCYVYNFKNPDVPNILNLPAGTGVAFKKKMDELINDLQQEIPKIFESKEYEKQKTNILHEFQEKYKITIGFENREKQLWNLNKKEGWDEQSFPEFVKKAGFHLKKIIEILMIVSLYSFKYANLHKIVLIRKNISH